MDLEKRLKKQARILLFPFFYQIGVQPFSSLIIDSL